MDLISDFEAREALEAINREKNWHRQNYTTEHSPLAGEIGESFCHDFRYLPCLKYQEKMTWKSDDLEVPEHTLSNQDFTPRYLHHKRFEGIRILERLPSELRFSVYHELIHTWNSFTAFPETIHKRQGAKLGMARRNRLPVYGPQIDTLVRPCSFDSCLNDTTFDQKFGKLDYFKDADWESIKASVKAMRDFQNFREPSTGVSLSGRSREGVVDVLEDFMSYFWNETVLDVRFHAGHMQHSSNFYILQNSAALYRFPLQERILHSRIRHITLEASPGEVASDWFLRTTYTTTNFPYHQTHPHQQAFYPNRGPSRFIQRCKFVTAHLPNLRTASIFISIDPDALSQLRFHSNTHRKDPRAVSRAFKAMTPWRRTVMNIPAKEKVDVVVLVTPGSGLYTAHCLEGSCSSFAEKSRSISDSLQQYFSPKYVGRFDGDQYSSLGKLFEES